MAVVHIMMYFLSITKLEEHMSNARNIASGAKFVDTSGDTMTGRLSIGRKCCRW